MNCAFLRWFVFVYLKSAKSSFPFFIVLLYDFLCDASNLIWRKKTPCWNDYWSHSLQTISKLKFRGFPQPKVNVPLGSVAALLITDQEFLGSILVLMWDFSLAENYYMIITDWELLFFSVLCPCSFLCCLGGDSCTPLTTGQGTPFNCVRAPICGPNKLPKLWQRDKWYKVKLKKNKKVAVAYGPG